MTTIRLALPKGRMQKAVAALLSDAGLTLRETERGYRPDLLGLGDVDTKVLKPQNVVGMLALGSRDIGFAGADWVAEMDGQVVELLDTQLDPVRIVAAAPEPLLVNGALPDRRLLIATELERITQAWIDRDGLDAQIVRTFGATEVFPPEDADCIVDITQTGATLRANDLAIVAELMRSSTRLYASAQALEVPEKREWCEALTLLIRSVLDARSRVMLEVNVTSDLLDGLVGILPCMKTPTVAALHGDAGYAVKVAVDRATLPTLIPRITQRGGTDLVVTPVSQIVA